MGDHVHVRLHGEDHLGFGGTAHVAAGDVIGVDGIAVNPGMRDFVDAAKMVGAPKIDGGFESGVGPAIEYRTGLSGLDGPVLHHPGLDGHHRRVARVAGHQFLDVIHDHLHRTARTLGQVVAERHVHERALASEIAADGARVEHDVLRGNAPGRS